MKTITNALSGNSIEERGNWLGLVSRHRVLATLVFFAIFPVLMPYHSVAINVLIFGLYAVGFNLLFGYTGLLSFGHAAFLGVGAYGAGILIAQYGTPWWIAIAAAIFMTTLVALIMGLLAIRTRGIYFAMVTLALSQCESPRVLRRLHTLRRWSHEQEIKPFFTRGARARCSLGA